MKFDRQAFWKNPGAPANVDAYGENVISHCRPEFYLDLVNVTRLVVETLNKYASPEMHILELGSGTGRNLASLHQAGYKYLCGLEINQDAVNLGNATFPEFREIPVLVAPVEDAIANYIDFVKADVVFTQGLLMHLPPDQEWVIQEMAKKARRLIITIEGERPPSFHAWPHDYQKIIEAEGWQQVEAHSCEAYAPFPKTTIKRVFTRITPLPDPVETEEPEFVAPVLPPEYIDALDHAEFQPPAKAKKTKKNM
jgi:SAM-dependent methyltransferase